MYFTIKKWQEKEEIDKVISTFSEVEKMNDDRFKHPIMDYYYLDIKQIRKIKILSLHDESAKKRLKTLQTLLYDKELITLSEEKPQFISESGTTGSSGTNGRSGTSGSSGSKPSSTDLNFDLNINTSETPEMSIADILIEKLKFEIENVF